MEAGTVTVKADNPQEALSRLSAIKKINALDTSTLKKLEQMCTQKGVKTLKNPMYWGVIKKYF